jgi:hypothetical protein
VAIDFTLIDIWTQMARPALELIAPHLRCGSIVMCDNTLIFAEAYRDYLAFIRDPINGFRSVVLPFGEVSRCRSSRFDRKLAGLTFIFVKVHMRAASTKSNKTR